MPIVIALSSRAYADVCAEARRALDDQQWSAAEVLIDQCAAQGAPAWLADARADLAPKLEAMAPVWIESAPASAEVTVSTFPASVRFTPRTIHLPTGTHVITATAPDHERKQHTVKIIDQMAVRVIFELRSLLAPPPSPPQPSIAPWLVIGTGAAIILGAGIYHITELEPEREALADAVDPAHDPDVAAYAKHSERFDDRRRVTLGMYGLGVATLLAGSIWAFIEHRRFRAAEVTAVPTQGGAFVGMSWRL